MGENNRQFTQMWWIWLFFRIILKTENLLWLKDGINLSDWSVDGLLLWAIFVEESEVVY